MFKVRKLWSRLVATLLCGLGLSAAALGQQTVGLLVNDTPQEGLTLISPSPSTRSYLVNQDGLFVHDWIVDNRGGMGYLTDGGTLVHTSNVFSLPTRWVGVAAVAGHVAEYDWNGNVLWEYEYSDDEYTAHHDFTVLPNGNVLLIAFEVLTQGEAIAEGKDPALITGEVFLDHIVEVEPSPPGGAIVWEWHARDHLIQDNDPTSGNFGPVGDHPELIDFNFSAGGARDYLHFNGIAYDERFDQIVVSTRTFSEIWVIDHSTTSAEAAGHTGGTYGKGGDLFYRWGNPQAYRRGTPADQQLWGQHDPQWIEPGSPGAGNLLIFSNGVGRPGGNASTVEEIVPPIDENGFFEQPGPGEAFAPDTPLWTYAADPPTSFLAPGRSGSQRQPNGNTLICNSSEGRLFEVDSAGNVVWMYVNPINQTGAVDQGNPPGNNGMFKVRKYPPDFPGFAGLDLTPGNPLEDGYTPPEPVPQGSLLVERLVPDGSSLGVGWDASSCTSGDYNLIYGELSQVSSYALSGAECAIGVTGSHVWTGAPAADLFFMIVGTEDLGLYESSWGRHSQDAERFGTKASFLCGTTTKVVTSTCP